MEGINVELPPPQDGKFEESKENSLMYLHVSIGILIS